MTIYARAEFMIGEFFRYCPKVVVEGTADQVARNLVVGAKRMASSGYRLECLSVELTGASQ